MAKLKCCGCKDRFPKESMVSCPAGNFHSIDCLADYAIKLRDKGTKRRLAKAKAETKEAEKAERKQHRKDKERIKSKAQWAREAQAAVNAYIRARDYGKPCISCDQSANIGQRHASHYRSVGACSQLRFNTFNIHASCAQCNSMKSGNILEYRIRLIKKSGQPRVDWLECQNEIVRHDIEYFKRIKRIFAKRARLANNRLAATGIPG